MRRTAVIGLVAGVLVLGSTATAGAAPRPVEVAPVECLEAFSDEDVDYIGEGWLGNQVAPAPALHPLAGLWDDTDRDFRLYCGDELSGVVHVAHPDSTGTVHPVTEDDQDAFVNCWRATIATGTAEPVGDRRTRFVLEFREGEYAIAYVDNGGRFTYTLFTTGEASNNWRPCFVKLA